MDKREEIQRVGLNQWAKNDFKGTLNWATGVGKTFAAILAVEHVVKTNSKAKILIVAPTHVILDNFKSEFNKFRKSKLLKHCKFICYSSIIKEKGPYDLVVLDEIHRIVTDNRLKFFKVCTFDKLLGLSASLTESQKSQLHPLCPVVHKLSVQDVVDAGFVSKFTIINFPIELTNQEKVNYAKYTSVIEWTYSKFKRNAWKTINSRASLVYTAKNKIHIINKIVELLPNEYGVIFSLKKDYAEYIADELGETCIAIHSGHSKKQRQNKLKAFSDGRTKIRLLSAPKILDEGVTLPRLSYGILVARYSKERQFIQSLGRLLRLDGNFSQAIAIRLYAKGTIEEKWVSESQKDFNVINVTNYEELRKKIDEIRSN